MTPEQELVQRLREFVRRDEREATPILEDLADQYGELCRAVNTRLRRCAEFLAKGMRSEAVHEAALATDKRALNYINK